MGQHFAFKESRRVNGQEPALLCGLKPPMLKQALSIKQLKKGAAAYLVELLEFQPQGPYQLGGYCMGGVIALEMARQLRAQGRQVNLLLLIDCFAPGLRTPYR